MATAPGRLGKKSKGKKAEQGSQTHKLPALADEHLDISALETWLWDAACAIRGATDAPKFKDFILPLIFYKRLLGCIRRRVCRPNQGIWRRGNCPRGH